MRSACQARPGTAPAAWPGRTAQPSQRLPVRENHSTPADWRNLGTVPASTLSAGVPPFPPRQPASLPVAGAPSEAPPAPCRARAPATHPNLQTTSRGRARCCCRRRRPWPAALPWGPCLRKRCRTARRWSSWWCGRGGTAVPPGRSRAGSLHRPGSCAPPAVANHDWKRGGGGLRHG